LMSQMDNKTAPAAFRAKRNTLWDAKKKGKGEALNQSGTGMKDID